jgi:hypothetical protein
MSTELLKNSYVIHTPVYVHDIEDKVINDVIFGPNFPWYWQDYQTTSDDETVRNSLPIQLRDRIMFHNGPYLSHTLLKRAQSDIETHNDRPDDHYSIYWRMFLEIFHRFTIKNNIKYTNIFRANLNLTWHSSNAHTAPHLDHEWPHNNFIMYLTNCTDGKTIIWTDDFSTNSLVPCIKYTASTFKQHWHAQQSPLPGTKRIVFVVTYI